MNKNRNKHDFKYTYDTVDDNTSSSPGFGHRHIQAFLMLAVTIVVYAIRTAMSVAIIAMVDTSTNSTSIPIFEWDKQTQDIILSSFYWGYALMQIPAGVIAFHFGAWFLLTFTMAVNSIGCLLIPWMTQYGGWKVMCATRFLTGVTQGFVFPCIHTLLGNWAPMQERGRLNFAVYCGVPLGTMISQPLAGLLAGSEMGWPSIFYVSGGSALFVGVLWFMFGSSSPKKHTRMSLMEKTYIEKSLNYMPDNGDKPTSTPWRAILTSRPVWTLILTQLGWNIGFVILLMETPSYMNHVLKINVTESGLLSGLPHIANWFVSLFCSFMTDYLINKKIVSTLTCRKIMNTIGYWLPALFLVILSYLPPEETTLGIVIITATLGFIGATYSGFLINNMDLSTNFAGVLLGLASTISNLISTAGPITVGYILTGNESDQSKWRIVFLGSAAIFFVSNALFLVYGSADEQPWNRTKVPQGENETNDNEETASI